MKKRILSCILILSIVLSACITGAIYSHAANQKEITVYTDGVKVNFDTGPIIESGRTLVPVRAIFESMGMSVNWDESSWTVTANGNGNTVTMRVNEMFGVVNGVVYVLDVPSRIVNGRTLVPVRFIAESLNKEVLWDGENNTVNIYTKVVSDDKVRTLNTGYTSALPNVGDIKFDFDYSDSYFVAKNEYDNGYGYNHDLLRASLALQVASWTPEGNYEENTGLSKQYMTGSSMKNILSLYSQMNFGGIEQHNYNKSLYDSSDAAAYSFANKRLYDGSILIAVTIRGAGYGAEWRSNFNVGTGMFHNGFYTPAKDIYTNLEKYIISNGFDKSKVKIWLTGFSRSGAIANILGGMINDNKLIERNNLYAYLFAVPNGVNLSYVNASDKVYENIKNVILPHDVIPQFVFENWNWGRYGKTLTVKNVQSLPTDGNVMYFKKLTSSKAQYSVGTEQTLAVNQLIDHLAEIIPTQTKYSASYQGFVMDMAEWSLFRRLEGEDIETFVKQRYSSNSKLTTASTFFNKEIKPVIIGVDLLAALTTGKTIISGNDKVYNLVYWGSILMHMNGMGKDDILILLNSFIKEYRLYSVIFSPNAAVSNISDTISSASTVADAHNSEYYISWMFGYNNPKDIFQN